MSKFNLLKDYLDFKNAKIQPRKIGEGVIPITKQEEVIVPLRTPEISRACAIKTKAKLATLRGQMNEYGIGGYMSNQKDPFASTILAPSKGIELRDPHTIIIGEGKCFVATDRELTKQGVFILTKDVCESIVGPEEKEPK